MRQRKADRLRKLEEFIARLAAVDCEDYETNDEEHDGFWGFISEAIDLQDGRNG